MSLVLAKFIDKDANSLEASGSSLRVKADGVTIERTASGLAIVAGGVDTAQLAADAVDETILDLAATYNFVGTLQYGGVNVATETYVNNAIQGLDPKDSVKCATTADITLSGEQTIDGVLTSASRVLVKNQTAPAENGIYLSGAGAWSRVADADSWDEHVAAFVWVEEGTTNADSGWLCTVDAGGTLDTTAVTWTQFSGAGSITAGTGLSKTGNTINFNATDDSLTVNADDVAVNVDDATIETAAGVGIRVKAAGVNENHIVSTALGGGLTGGSGTVISVVPGDLISGGSKEVDGDNIDIDWNPSNYTPDATPAEASGVDSLTAHLKGIDDEIGTINAAVSAIAERRVETFTLDGTDISNGYVTLAATPAAAGRVVLGVKGAPGQHYGDDYQMDGGNPDRVTWSGLGLDTVLASGDKLTVSYDV